MNKGTTIGMCAGLAIGVALMATLGAATTDGKDAVEPTPTPIVTVEPAPVVTPTPEPSPVVTEAPAPTPEVKATTPPTTAAKPAPIVTFKRPVDGERAQGPVTARDDNVLFCGVEAGVAIDVDEYGNAWAYCEPALAGE